MTNPSTPRRPDLAPVAALRRACPLGLIVLLALSIQLPAQAQMSTTGSQRSRRGALIEEFQVPTTGTDHTRTPEKTELEKHEEKKEYFRRNPGPVYDPNLKAPPPPQTRQRTPEERKERDRLKKAAARRVLLKPGETTAPESLLENTDPVTTAGDLSRVIMDSDAPARYPRTSGNPLEAKGPGPLDAGQAENAAPSNRVVGAANVIACSPVNRNVLYAGFTNGGVWKTENAVDQSPLWLPKTDDMGSLSIGALEFDPTDTSAQTMLAAVGRFSSLGTVGGQLIGLLRTTNGGDNWTLVDGGGVLVDKNFCGAAIRGDIIVGAVNIASPFVFTSIGILRSTDGGASFSNVAYVPGSGLPKGRSFDLQSDPTTTNVLYTVIRDADTANGLYKSSDVGATWQRVSNATMNAMMVDSKMNNAHIHVGQTGTVGIAIVNNSRLAGVFISKDDGATWTDMGVPTTTETDGTVIGVHAGGQGTIHLSFALDPVDPDIVYVGGDRQPGPGDYNGSWPNSIGANNYSGRLFRGNLGEPTATRWQHLTHSRDKGVAGGGTTSNSAPHADSRDMEFDKGGRLIEGDDGGVYCRTLPHSDTGDWFAMQGTLQTTEVHDVDYDSVSDKIIAGTQDNGVPGQRSDNTWVVISQGDGGDVQVDDKTYAGSGQSIRYSSYQTLSGLTRRTYNAAGVQTNTAVCQLTPQGGDPAIQPQFYTPLRLNKVAPTAMLIGAQNGIYESADQGATVRRVLANVSVGDGLSGVGLAYGGRKDGANFPAVAYAVDGSRVYVRTAAGNFPTSYASISTGGDILLDVVLNSEDYTAAYCLDKNQVFHSTNTGANWSDVTGDLMYSRKAGDLRCIEFMPNTNGGAILVGAQTGVYIASVTDPTAWTRFGINLPASAYVYDMEYDATDDVLVVGTLGRGVWMMQNAAAASTGSAVGEWHSY